MPVAATTRLVWIVDGMGDDYTAVRWMAWRGAKRLATAAHDDAAAAMLEGFDPNAAIEDRIGRWQRLRQRVGPSPLAAHPERPAALENRRDGSAILIGE